MLAPALFNDTLFDDLFDFGFPYKEFDNIDKKLYGKHAARVMKTDVREHDDHFEAEIDLPGFSKDQIALDLTDGYLTVSAEKGHGTEKKDKDGKIIRQERYSGSMQRSFYVGEDITEDDIKAKFADGVLSIIIPKKDPKPQIPERKRIAIQ
ncbi:MAG: Hsp20/alpha crystallin family protein [Oscillospiraceae bacterium]|nr:Hsp20/alpha crystallin family protein [Oscillospiraceae bacterium]